MDGAAGDDEVVVGAVANDGVDEVEGGGADVPDVGADAEEEDAAGCTSGSRCPTG